MTEYLKATTDEQREALAHRIAQLWKDGVPWDGPGGIVTSMRLVSSATQGRALIRKYELDAKSGGPVEIRESYNRYEINPATGRRKGWRSQTTKRTPSPEQTGRMTLTPPPTDEKVPVTPSRGRRSRGTDQREKKHRAQVILPKAAVAEALRARLFVGSLEAEEAVRRALARMPSEVRADAIDQCVFLAVGRDVRGACLRSGIIGDASWIVLLDDKLSVRSLENAVAHEVAHALLGHEPGSLEHHDENERAARRSVREWGFRGFGAEPTYDGRSI